MADFTVLYGPISTPQSSWVSAIAYLHVKGYGTGVAIQFVDQFQAFYPGTDKSMWNYIRKSRSKGRAVHSRFFDLDYVAL